VLAPLPLHVDADASVLYMDYVAGESLKQRLRSPALCAEARIALAHQVSRAVARLHDGNIVHGDLTTSNMLLRAADDALVRA
jgi:TP53 regulating kinase-like protein